jgi:hypothetical protein
MLRLHILIGKHVIQVLAYAAIAYPYRKNIKMIMGYLVLIRMKIICNMKNMFSLPRTSMHQTKINSLSWDQWRMSHENLLRCNSNLANNSKESITRNYLNSK